MASVRVEREEPIRAAGRAAALAFLTFASGCSLLRPPEEPVSPAAAVHPAPTAVPAAPAPAGPRSEAAPPSAPVAKAPEPAPAPVAPSPPVSTRHYQLGPATGALVAQAQAAGGRADYLTAMSTLERAVRIEPRNPLVWIEMAKVRLAAGEAQQAESVARKAVALSEGDQRTSNEAWKQVALALKAQNRNPEAAAAEARASRPFVDARDAHRGGPDH